MSDFYNYHEDKQECPGQSTNDYNYYRQTSDAERRTYSPYDTPEPNKPEKKKGNFGVKLVKAVCLGLAFGLVAGGVFWGIGSAVGVTAGKGEASNVGMNVNIVKTSSTDVKTISATDVSDIVEQCMPSIVRELS